MSFNKTQSNSKLKYNGALKYLALFVMLIASMFTFVACDLFKDAGGGIVSNFDADGKLRVYSPVVDYYANGYSSALLPESPGANIIDDTSGSFVWELQYYFTGEEPDANNDQNYLLMNLYKDAEMTNLVTQEEMSGVFMGSKPHTSGNAFYIKEGSNGSVTRLYTGADFLLQNDFADKITFPSFEVVVDGKYYTFKIEIDKSKLERKTISEPNTTDGQTINKAEFDSFTKNPFKDRSYDYDSNEWKNATADDDGYGQLFKFSYRL